MPELADVLEPLPPWTVSPEQERRLLFGAVARYLVNVAGPAGTLLLLDDLHWAGRDALDLLATVPRTGAAAGASLRVLGAYRDTEVQAQDALAVALADLAHARLATQHLVRPLAPVEAAELLQALLPAGAPVDPALRERVVQRTGGVPFFLVNCAQVLCTESGESALDEVVPWDVAQGIRQRVAALPEPTQQILSMAAVVGRRVPPALLGQVTAHHEEEVLSALETARRAGLLVEGDQAGYQFTHDLIWEVVERDLGTARRTMWHRRVAEALEQASREPPVEQLAYHYARSSEQDKAVLYLEQAGDRAAAQYAHATAESYYREAVERLEGLGQAHTAAGIREKLGAVLLTAARYDEAITALEPAVETYRVAVDREGEGRVTAQIGMAYARCGRPVDGLARIQPVLERLDVGVSSSGLARLYLALAYLYHYSEQLSRARVAAERASALATALGDDIILAESEAIRGVALDYLGEVEAALQVLGGAIGLAEATGQEFALCDALNMAAHIYAFWGEFVRGRPYIDRALAVAERTGIQEFIAFLPFHLGFVAFYMGDWTEARRHGARAAVLLSDIDASWSAGYGTLILGLISYGEGRWEEAADYLEQTVRHGQRTKRQEALRIAQSVLAELEVRQGRATAARERLLPLLVEPRAEGRDIAFVLPKLAWAHLELDDLDAARRVAEEAVAYARAKSDRLNLVEALRVQALVALRQERWAEAGSSLDYALSLAKRMGYPWGEAHVLHVYGDLHVQRGEPGPARERLEEALAIFRRLGARKDSEWTEVALRHLR